LQFIMLIERRFDLRISPRDIMSIATLADVVRIMEDA
jgi:acyl carrier protein